MNRFKVFMLAFISVLLLIQTVCYADNQPKVAPNQPFQKSFLYNDYHDFTGTFQVPNDKRLVIEYASAFVATDEQGAVFTDPPEIPETIPPNLKLFVKTTVNGEVSPHFWRLVHTGKEGRLISEPIGGFSYWITDYFTGSQQMRLYADPGSTVEVILEMYDGCHNGHCHKINLSTTLSGYLADPKVSP